LHLNAFAGERLWLVGDAEVLGNWDAGKAAKMKWGEGHTWSVSLPFPQGTKVTYKVGADNQHTTAYRLTYSSVLLLL
jgi:hypothetical protein